MIFLPTSYGLTKSDIGRITKALEAALAAYPGDDDLANGETLL